MSNKLIWRLENNHTAKDLCWQAALEIRRLQLALMRIDNFNDDPRRFSQTIDQITTDALKPYRSGALSPTDGAVSHPEPAPMRSERSERATPNQDAPE